MTTYAPAEASERTGLTLDTLRYYERLGLFGPVRRTTAGRRVYSDHDVAWVGLLVCLRNAGLGISDLQRLMGRLRDSGSSTGVVELLEEHRSRLHGEIAKMSVALDVLDGKIAHYREAAGQSKK
ncbi:DNA-binding transcriptional MerR regulator [Kribbella sp. VKM Ac-2569]|uniref:MerR family transcriptional regulator n=1 Tax=Kribbella sp. VKM Ac-2569 TaxID=2512220 RepID=UPI00102B144F|nr:MerR family transcriptional regulator [Kribbella sp. VKM Ac-2569]RZT19503.1 DNA-binding transcriptional MerR regulator [Kribbella sp. VKM Ac-2569]